MPYTPQPGFILCQPLKKESQTASGLTLPDAERDRNANIAEVVAIGADLIIDETVRLKAPELEQGDIIAYKQYSDIEVDEDFTKIVFVPFEQIVGIKKGVGHAAD